MLGWVQDRVRRGGHLFAAAALLLLGSVATCHAAAIAGTPDPAGERFFAGTGSCPAPAALRTQVETLVPRERLNARLRAVAGTGTGLGAPIEIVDLGARFRVIAAGSVREYRDEGRDCSYRARVAAVFVALVIDPAAILPARPGVPPEAAVVAPPSPAAPPAPAPVRVREPVPAPVASSSAAPKAAPTSAPASPPPSTPLSGSTSISIPAPATAARPGADVRARVLVSLGADVEGGLGSDARVGSGGLALRVGIGAGRLALAVGAAAQAPVDTTIGGIHLHQWRLPADVSLRAQGTMRIGQRRALEPYGELGVALALLRESGLDLSSSQTHTTAELGLRAAAGLQLVGDSRFAPFIALHAEVVPSPPAISALPRGVVGHTPLLWLGAAAGAAWRFF